MSQSNGYVLDGGSMFKRDRSPRVAQARHGHMRQAESLAERAELAGDGIGVKKAQETRPTRPTDGAQALKRKARKFQLAV